MKKIGMKMSMALTLPLALIGAAAFKTSMDFETSMTKIIGLVGIAREQVNAWSDDLLDISSNIGKSPKELADALFFITSAGIRGAEALEVLEMAAKASAVGLGETKTVADLVSSAMNAYGSDVLSATKATDILVATVREGKAEAPELASAMGMVLPIASAMGVSFDQVGAAVASMTRTGTNAATSAMQLRQILASFLKPTEQAKEMMLDLGMSFQDVEAGFAAVGTSAADFRKIIAEEGLFAALQKLKILAEDFGEEALPTVFANIRALTGVLDLTGDNMEDTAKIFKAMTDTTDSLSNAMAETAKTTKQKLNVALAKGKVALTVIGNTVRLVITPVFEYFGNVLENISDWFRSLSDTQKRMVVTIGGLVAALGPLLVILGFIISSIIPALVTGFMAVRGAFVALNTVIMANPYAALLTVIALVVTAMITFGRKTKEVSKFHSEYYGMLAKEKSGLDLLFSSLNNAAKGTRERKIALDQINKIYGKYLPDLLTEKSNTEDLAKAYDLINKALIQNITLKARQADIAKITNESIEVQKTIVSEVTIGGGAEAALTLGRIRDNIDKLKENKIAIPMSADIDYANALKVFDDLQAAGAKIKFPVPDEMVATVKVLQLQNQEQEKLNNIYAFYSLRLKDANKDLTNVNTETGEAADTINKLQKTVGKFETPGENLSLVLNHIGLKFRDLSLVGSKGIQDLTDLVLPNMKKLKAMFDKTNQAMKDSIPTILQYRNAFANFDVMDGITSEIQDFGAKLNQVLKDAIGGAIEGASIYIGEQLGNLMSGEKIEVGGNILKGIGSFIKKLGSALVTVASLMIAFDTQIAINPFVALALGIAAIAAGTALMNIANKGPAMGGVQGLATGGVVTSGGIFEVGEKGSEMVTLPRGSAVTPHGGGMMQELYAKISGEDIYLSNKRYGSKLGKVT
jgi:TP901 family phage tail tape measure protein